MKNMFSLIALLLCVGAVMGQTASNTESRDSSNIYYQAFKHSGTHFPSNNDNTLLVEENNITTESLPDQLSGHKIEIIDVWELQKRLRKVKSLVLIRIVPLQVNEGHFFVNIIPFKVTKSRSGFSFINCGGSKVEFLYDCTSRTFSLKKVINRGI